MMYDDYVYTLSTAAPQPVHSVTLPKDLLWADELNWSPVAQNVSWSLTGALFIEEGVKQKGRSITLVGIDNMAWVTREVGLALQAMAAIPGLIMQLKFVNTVDVFDPPLFTHNVMFRHADNPALDLKHIKQWDQYEAGAWYIVNSIKLIETLAYGA